MVSVNEFKYYFEDKGRDFFFIGGAKSIFPGWKQNALCETCGETREKKGTNEYRS